MITLVCKLLNQRWKCISHILSNKTFQIIVTALTIIFIVDVAPPGSLLVDLDVTNKKGKKKKKKRLSKKAKAKLLKKGLPIPEEEDDDDDDDGDGDGIGAKFDVLSVEDVPEGAEISDNDVRSCKN